MASTTPRLRTGSRMIQCRYCDKSYSKPEHVLRHERSHTGVKPFTCKYCSKAFGRQDSLGRHIKLHENENGAHSTKITPPKLPTSYETQCPQTDRWPQNQQSNLIVPVEVINQDQVQSHTQTYDETHSSSEAGTVISPESSCAQSLQRTLEAGSGSDDLLQFLLSDSAMWPIALPVTQVSPFSFENLHNSQDSMAFIEDEDQQVGSGRHAMQQLSRLIKDLSSRLTAEVEATGINSKFLDICLHMFFTQFIPTFPVLNRATFTSRECGHPLLLNIIALGSLFVGEKDALRKGEALWRLAHTAVATSWQGLITHQGSSDACKGVQLVLTALFGQIYAVLSKNESLRLTSQTMHGLGFFWARQCGMYEMNVYQPFEIPSIDASSDEKTKKWKAWTSVEVQRRAILGHYILDGQIAQSSGHATSVRHVGNSLFLPSSEAIFNAKTADAWIIEVKKQSVNQISFREVFAVLFNGRQQQISQLSPFSIRVALEGLQSLISEHNEAGGFLVGTPSRAEISRVLLRIYHEHISLIDYSYTEDMGLRLRWHTICLDMVVNTPKLGRQICYHYGVQQSLLGWGNTTTDGDLDITRWSSQIDARRALLHSVSILKIVEEIPIGRAHAIHIPTSIFAAATWYFAQCLVGSLSVLIPNIIDWHQVWNLEQDESLVQSMSPRTHGSETEAYLLGDFSPVDTSPYLRYLLYDFNNLQMLLKSISSRWGVAYEMEKILNQWVAILDAST